MSSKFDIQGNGNSRFVLNFKKSSYYSVQRSVWSNNYRKLCQMAKLLVMENYQTVYVDGNNENMFWLCSRRGGKNNYTRSKYFKIFRNSKEENLN